MQELRYAESQKVNQMKNPFLIFYTPNLLYSLQNLKPLNYTIRVNLELMPIHSPLKLVPAPYIDYFA